MNCRSIIKMTVIIFGMIISFNLAASAQTTNCSQQTDQEMVLAVYAKLKPAFDAQLDHINVRADANDGVVVLEGWVAKKSDIKKITSLLKNMDCVNCVVIAKLTVGKGIGCGPGQQECGGTCISNKEVCNICLLPGKCD